MSKDNQEETFTFDKFMEDIVQREGSRPEQDQIKEGTDQKYEETPQRKYNRLYRELWQNRVVYRHPENGGK